MNGSYCNWQFDEEQLLLAATSKNRRGNLSYQEGIAEEFIYCAVSP